MNLIVGDSHIRCLKNYQNKKNQIVVQSASSIRGLLNEKSKTNAGGKIINLASSLKFDKLFIMFGKVDLEWVYPYKSKEETIEIKDFIEETIDRYIKFIKKISVKFKVIYVMGLHLPSLEKEEMINCLNSQFNIRNVSSHIGVKNNFNQIKKLNSLKKRTEEIIMFNNILIKKISNINSKKYYYMDITNELLDNETKTCKKYFIKNKDHHLKEKETGIIWYQKYLKSAFYS